ncbi:helix-turn-helix domain-containing protein [Actinomadura alba]|uniref:Helix-turn-helix domain-containing protein n=1 Tax=Actinomadura alba TaxID=406431 RepID=A0ABR7LUR3_9ACTN|nr:PucR family transcriptional regulator [Actinomadura alba]MBC6468593.1 helix-turn-helix domain-containing protein [Actinomadura alba]
MTKTLESGGLDESPGVLPPQLAAVLRPELPSLSSEIITEIRRSIPEYARPLDGPYGQALRSGVEQALTTFVDQIAVPSAPHDRRDDTCRRLGQLEALEGRTMDNLQAAYRIGAHVAWRRAMKVGMRNTLSSSIMTRLADALFIYIDELASLSLEGYLEAKAQSAEEVEERRRRLLHVILEGPDVPRRAISDLAELADWPVPDEVTLVAVQTGAQCTGTSLDRDVLTDLCCVEPHLLVPGPLGPDQRAALETVLAGNRAAVGLTVPLTDAAESLRWARQALALNRAGTIGNGHVTWCEDHLVTLWLLSDAALLHQLARRQFAPMHDLTPRQRDRLTQTLGAWLETRGTAAEIADVLDIHPQTVRYRIRQLDRILGDQLKDPDARFALELVLRATRLRAGSTP